MTTPQTDPERRRSRRLFASVIILAAVTSVAVTALLINIFERKQEARNPFYRVVELSDTIDDPATWAKNFPLQYDL
jgi:nitrite reductase (cytochrome c-552)